jgi:hypothetical protein
MRTYKLFYGDLMAEETSLTRWMDPAFEYFARETGIPVDQLVAQQGGEGIGTALEILSDYFTKGWLNKGLQFVVGLIANSYAVWGKDVPTRLRRELIAMGTHELLRILTMPPAEAAEFQASLATFMSAVQRGDWSTAAATVFKTPTELRAAFAAAGVPMVPPAPTPVMVPPRPAPAAVPPAAARGRYLITG